MLKALRALLLLKLNIDFNFSPIWKLVIGPTDKLETDSEKIILYTHVYLVGVYKA